MNYVIGQVWQVSEMAGTEVLSTRAMSHQTRIGVLTGIDLHNGGVEKLYFSRPMISGRRTGEVHTRNWPPEGSHVELLGVLHMETLPRPCQNCDQGDDEVGDGLCENCRED